MQIQLISDTHLEFHQDQGESFVRSLDPTGVDVLVIAGDLTIAEDLERALRELCARYGSAQVVFVAGNHDHYGAHPHRLETLKASIDLPNLHWLWNDQVEIDGVRFLGTTLWFRDDPLNPLYQGMLSDFRAIRALVPWVYEENQKALEFLGQNVTSDCVVVTHHTPTQQSVHPRFWGSPLNRFFLCNVEDLIRERQPRAWFHGHTHSRFDYRIGNTRVACNPLGYPGECPGQFNDRFLVEV